jgi:thioredoxin-dependent peroxiredoxin
MQLYQLTQRYAKLNAMGLEIVAVFASSPAEVKRFILQREHPFAVAA